MTAHQSLSEIVALDQIAAEYSPLVQASGLRTTIIDTCRRDATSPADLRRMLTRTLQNTLPASAPRSVRADGSHIPGDGFSAHERKVQAAVIEAAHQSTTLRPVIERDATGREQTSFYGQKSSWMGQYKSPPRLAKTIGGAPVRLAVIL